MTEMHNDLLVMTADEGDLFLAGMKKGLQFQASGRKFRQGPAEGTLHVATNEASARRPEEASRLQAALFTLLLKLQYLPPDALPTLKEECWGMRRCEDGRIALGYGSREEGYERPWESEEWEEEWDPTIQAS